MKNYFIIIIAVIFACKPAQEKEKVLTANLDKVVIHKLLQDTLALPIQNTGNTICERFMPPKGFIRTTADTLAFESYLRNLPLKPEGTEVMYYNGAIKRNNDVYDAVVDLPIGDKDLHQCADAIMRLRAEYFWSVGEFDKIHFNLTNGFRVNYLEWMKGRRIVARGNETYWQSRNAPSNNYTDFWDYLELIFTYAGTASLELELKPIGTREIEIGDVLIKGGHPGHAVIIVDRAFNNQTGKNVYLLAQSYMPAQEIQVLKNPLNEQLSPWYNLDTPIIVTPEWRFTDENIRRF